MRCSCLILCTTPSWVTATHMEYNAGASGYRCDKGKEHNDSVYCLVGGAKVEQKVIPLRVICSFLNNI
jgi:hypothetical protein